MSACSAQAMSQVGWRLRVASSAKTRRPLVPCAAAATARACATKAAIASALDVSALGSRWSRTPSPDDVTGPERDLEGGSTMGAHRLHAHDVGRLSPSFNERRSGPAKSYLRWRPERRSEA